MKNLPKRNRILETEGHKPGYELLVIDLKTQETKRFTASKTKWIYDKFFNDISFKVGISVTKKLRVM